MGGGVVILFKPSPRGILGGIEVPPRIVSAGGVATTEGPVIA